MVTEEITLPADLGRKAIVGLERAVEWVKSHTEYTLLHPFWIYPDRNTPTAISFGYMSETSRAFAAIREMFPGQTATQTIDRSGNKEIRFMDQSTGLVFQWTVWGTPKRADGDTETITL